MIVFIMCMDVLNRDGNAGVQGWCFCESWVGESVDLRGYKGVCLYFVVCRVREFVFGFGWRMEDGGWFR